SRQLKVYAKELGVPILALSQMSRGAEKEGRAPQLSDLRDSGAIEQDADVVIFLHDPSKVDPNMPKDRIQLLIRKNRSGSMGDLVLNWDGNTTTFTEVNDDGSLEDNPSTIANVDLGEMKQVKGRGPMPFNEQAGGLDEIRGADIQDDDKEYTDDDDMLPVGRPGDEDLPF
ncbi:MAG: DnaB-like helicase C-terminal domain-containing protein, partial [Clostridia bacterium]|nr:DnaB-like helicase C-terminal domain-containing protein [Clostridia bacterium]